MTNHECQMTKAEGCGGRFEVSRNSRTRNEDENERDAGIIGR
jgi:hypothetical protein